jgi:hypothetical protein
LSGAMPLFNRGIALGGEMTETASSTPRRFFVGGAWEQPFVTPVE